jgi:hypothetical protein
MIISDLQERIQLKLALSQGSLDRDLIKASIYRNEPKEVEILVRARPDVPLNEYTRGYHFNSARSPGTRPSHVVILNGRVLVFGVMF